MMGSLSSPPPSHPPGAIQPPGGPCLAASKGTLKNALFAQRPEREVGVSCGCGLHACVCSTRMGTSKNALFIRRPENEVHGCVDGCKKKVHQKKLELAFCSAAP